MVEATLLFVGRVAPFILSVSILSHGCIRKKLAPSPLEFDSMDTDFQIQWSPDAFPITVIVDTNLPEPLLASVTHAVFTWNEALETNVFVVEYKNLKRELPDTQCGWIAVVQDNKMAHDGLWRGRYTDDFIICAAQISLKFNKVANTMARNNIAIHEFGHALGLAHDEDNPESIMHPKIWNDLSQHITEEDVRAIKEHYFSQLES